MLIYISIIACMAIISSVNVIFPALCEGLTWWQIILSTVGFTAGVILIDGIAALIVRRVLPQRWFWRGTRLVRVRPFEKKLYTALGIKKWKEKIPELGGFTNFHKDKIYRPTDNEYVALYIREANSGAFGHLMGMISGFLIVAVVPRTFLWISLPVAIVNFVLSAMPMMILRFNLPKLETLYKLNEKRASRSNGTKS
ncbi:MAG: hypothetical protein ILP02_04370 [Clostridia bacterium]|nr:hypothetical protein [Clostridia bacterium]